MPPPSRRLFPNLLPLLFLVTPLAAQQVERTSIGGYGEVHYTNASGPRTPGRVNVERFVLFVGHSFSDRLSVRSELELEDTKVEGGQSGGEIALEQLYLDYRFSDVFTLRTGLVLVPVGILNEVHEPPTFNGVDRPSFDQDVIPTTWRDIGIGATGRVPGVDGLSYRAYLVNGLKAEGFSGGTGIRGGKQEGKEASFANPSLTGRLEYGRPGLKLGASFWYGGTANQDSVLGSGTFEAAVTLLSADARYDVGAFSFRGELARIHVADAGVINARFGNGVGSRIEGGYLEGAVNLLAALAPGSTQKLNAFVRHERYNTEAAVPAGTLRDDALARRITTTGLAYKPLYNVVFKADYQLRCNRAAVGQNNVLSLGVGYQF